MPTIAEPIKADHVLVFPPRIDLAHMMNFFGNGEFVPEIEKCSSVVGFDDLLYKVVVARIYLPWKFHELPHTDPQIPLLWHRKLVAAYRIEYGKLVKIFHEQDKDGSLCELFDMKSEGERLGDSLTDVVSTMQVYTGPFGTRMLRESKTPT